VFAYGTQLERLFSQVPASQRLVLLFDELRRDSVATLRGVTEFLGVRDDGGGGIDRANPGKRLRSRRAAVWHRRGRELSGPIYGPAKRVANALGVYPSHLLTRWNVEEAPRAPLDPALREELRDAFAPEVARAERILGRALGWSAKPVLR
jgi:hypothetical protein